VTADGTSLDAQVAADTYVVWIQGDFTHLKIIATTATQVWTAVGGHISHTPR
jgi:hypothetical protein